MLMMFIYDFVMFHRESNMWYKIFDLLAMSVIA